MSPSRATSTRAAAPTNCGTRRPSGSGWRSPLGALIGLRQGEAAGLTIDRVDFLGRAATIDRQLVTPSAGEASLGLPKTARSYRTVPLADVAVDALARHVERFGTGGDGLLLHEGGAPVRR